MDSSGTQQVTATIPQAPGPAGFTGRQRWIDLGIVLLIAIVPSIINAVYLWIYPSAEAYAISNFRVAYGLFREASAMALLVYVLSRQNRTWKSIGLDFRWSDPFIAIGLTLAALFAVTLLSYSVKQSTWTLLRRAPDSRHPDLFSGALTVLMIAYSISAPIFEETIVRGYFTTELIQLGKPIWMATLASIVLQTSYHLYYGFAGALSISGVFIVFALYFAKSRRMLPTLLAHLYWDLLATFLHLHR